MGIRRNQGTPVLEPQNETDTTPRMLFEVVTRTNSPSPQGGGEPRRLLQCMSQVTRAGVSGSQSSFFGSARVPLLAIRGRPPRERAFHRQQAAKPFRCQRTTVSGLTIVIASRMRGQRR